MAPESIAKKRYSEASDSWSFGVYMWEVTHRQEPFMEGEIFAIATGVVNGTLRLAIDPAVAVAFGRCAVPGPDDAWQ